MGNGRRHDSSLLIALAASRSSVHPVGKPMTPVNGSATRPRWVTLKKYCAETGETEQAVRKRREKGTWLDGRHTMVRHRRIWVNMEAAQRWVETGS